MEVKAILLLVELVLASSPNTTLQVRGNSAPTHWSHAFCRLGSQLCTEVTHLQGFAVSWKLMPPAYRVIHANVEKLQHIKQETVYRFTRAFQGWPLLKVTQ